MSQFQGDSLVYQDRRLVGPQVWVVLQAGSLLGGAEFSGTAAGYSAVRRKGR